MQILSLLLANNEIQIMVGMNSNHTVFYYIIITVGDPNLLF